MFKSNTTGLETPLNYIYIYIYIHMYKNFNNKPKALKRKKRVIMPFSTKER